MKKNQRIVGFTGKMTTNYTSIPMVMVKILTIDY